MITIGIFAFNEEQNLRNSVEMVMVAAEKAGSIPLEIIIVNDGSTDGTEAAIAELKEIHPHIRSISHPANMGIGTAITDIVAAASCDKICFVPGDNIFSLPTLKTMLLSAYKADVVLHYHINSEARKKGRVFLSILFSSIYKFTFNLPILYVNCIGIYPTRLLKEMTILSKRHSIAAELNVKALLQGHSFYEVGSYMNPHAQKSSALSVLNVFDVISSFFRILYDVKVTHRGQYGKTPVRVIDSA